MKLTVYLIVALISLVQCQLSTELERRLGKCKPSVISMYASWSVYSSSLDKMLGTFFGEKIENSTRLNGCGEWELAAYYGETFSRSMILVQKETKLAIVAFRGTTAVWGDWKLNFETTKVTCSYVKNVNCGWVHKGFHNSYMEIQEKTESHATNLLKQGYDVILTGHSKGAAFAILSSFSLSFKNLDLRPHIHNIGFASPVVGDAEFAAAYDQTVLNAAQYMSKYKGYIFNEMDLVTTIPPRMLGFIRTKGSFLINCNKNYIGNPVGIKARPTPPDSFMQYLPATVGCHSQQCYLDGVITEEIIPASENDLIDPAFNGVNSAQQFDMEMSILTTFISEMSDKTKHVHTQEEKEICFTACGRYLYPNRAVDVQTCREICA
ncbi:phospholipase A1-II [Acrasis kona]|uniref:Phospholipase A1-II n=1 Tax=Acrasis kona TaxID=1008807 RepID=A0AAW2YZG2_9EUKA